MSETKFTGGNWRAGKNYSRLWVESDLYCSEGGTADVVCTIPTWGIMTNDRGLREVEREANAVFIAALPKVFAALVAILAYRPSYKWDNLQEPGELYCRWCGVSPVNPGCPCQNPDCPGTLARAALAVVEAENTQAAGEGGAA